MTNKLDLELLKEINSPPSLDEKVLRHASLKIAPKKLSLGKLVTSLSAAYCFGLITMVSINQLAPQNHSANNITGSDINLESLRVETRSGGVEKAKIDLNKLDDMQLKQIAKALAAKEQWHELEKLTLYIQKRRNK